MESTVVAPSPISPSPPQVPCGEDREDQRETSPAAGAPERCLIGGGLANLGNTCFLNVGVQCLVHTVPLVQALISSDHSSCCSGGSDERFCAICAFGNIVEFCLRASGRVVFPRAFVSNLSKISSSFQVYQQEDAHEFLSCLLDCLDSCDRRSHPSEKASPTQTSSFINDIFGGRLRSQVRCCECGHSSDTFEPMLDLSLEIENADNVTDALQSFTKVERIDGPWTCEGCKAQVSVDKQLTIDKLPAVVILHLKRFKSEGLSYHKIDKHVDCPKELDFGPFLCSRDEEVESMYDLYAVVVHSGFQLYSGHYYCFIRSSVNVWHEMDDSEVTRVSEEHVGMQDAYILFYKKRGSSPPWFADFMEKQVMDLYPHGDISPSSVLRSSQSLDCAIQDAVPVDTPKQGGFLSSCVSDPSTSRSVEADESMVDVASQGEIMEPSTSHHLEKQVSEAAYDQPSTTLPRPSIFEERMIDVFYDEHLEEEQEDYHIVLPKFKDDAKLACKVEVECGRIHETINSRMRSMPSSRRRALMAYMPPSHSSIQDRQRRRRRLS